MQLREEMLAQGGFLFRWRGILPFVLVPLGVVALLSAENPEPPGWHWFDDALQLVALSMSLLGLAMRTLTIGSVPKRTSGRGTNRRNAARLNTDGMYSLCRHPLYLGNYFCFLGLCMIGAIWWLPVIYSLVFWLYYERIMLFEEAFLREEFGRDYLDWSAQTPAFVPRFDRWISPTESFSWRMVLRRETSPWLGIAVGFWITESTLDVSTRGSMDLDLLWMTLSGLAGVAYVVVKILKEWTAILDSPRAKRRVDGPVSKPAGPRSLTTPGAGVDRHLQSAGGVAALSRTSSDPWSEPRRKRPLR